MKLIIIGPQGSGKGTQAKKISEDLQIPHISTGDIFRHNIKKETELGKQAKKYIDKGELVPDSLTTKLVLDRLSHIDCKAGFILDGYPRNLFQAEALDESIDIDFSIQVEVSDKESLKRISKRKTCTSCGAIFSEKDVKKCNKCGGSVIVREDDMPNTVKKRLQIYHENTKPVIKHYQKKGKLVKVNGEKDIESVFNEIKIKIKI